MQSAKRSPNIWTCQLIDNLTASGHMTSRSAGHPLYRAPISGRCKDDYERNHLDTSNSGILLFLV